MADAAARGLARGACRIVSRKRAELELELELVEHQLAEHDKRDEAQLLAAEHQGVLDPEPCGCGFGCGGILGECRCPRWLLDREEHGDH
jgi:hypothetical protein